ncbi:RICIN domain-containing protein [Ammonicoccus fulvus]|uniref:RICIN domain-containing protein n=1 Tax=Ammonicoccus fulvus TaxID=3138240 RepID=A0ABZ3FRN5_9ACTN
MTTWFRRPLVAFLGTLLIALGLVTGAPSQARAATITGITFNNVSRSAALNTNPASSAEVDDLSVRDGGRLYLPASADPTALSGWITSDDGTREAFGVGDYALTSTGDHEWSLTLVSNPTVGVTVYQSGSVPAMYVRTNGGLAAIEADKSHEDEGGSMALVGADTNPVYNGLLGEMKGRGNTTWGYPKKPYQVKLDKSTELVADAGAHKTWILLANYLDTSLIRNQVAYNLEGSALRRAGLTDHSIKGRMIDLWIDGDFRGSYYLAEKVQVGATRVNITDLEKANEAANPGTDLGSTPTVRAETTDPRFAGLREAQYAEFSNSPTGYQNSGYLFEMDFASGSRAERSYFITRQGTPFTVKAPEDANRDELAYASGFMQGLEDAIFSPTGRNAAGRHYTDYLDLQSFATYYAVQEAVANEDAFKSSAYFYLDRGGKLVAGPLWDCDRCLGSLTGHAAPESVHVGKWSRLKPLWIKQLLSHTDFRAAVRTAWTGSVKPELDQLLAADGRLSEYAAEVAYSAKLNKLRWSAHPASIASPTPAGDITWLRSYTTSRRDALGRVFGAAYTDNVRIPDGIYVIRNGRLQVDVSRMSTETGANIQLWDPNTTDAQRFRVTRGADLFYTITNVHSGKLLDVRYAAAANGTNVWQYPLTGTKAQKWTIGTYDGVNYTIASALGIFDIGDTGGREDGHVLDAAAAGQTAGTNIQIWADNGTSAQQFRFAAVDTTPPPPPPAPEIVEGVPYALASGLNRAKVLDVRYASPARGTNVQLWDFNGSSAQRFTFHALGDGSYQILTGPGGAVDVAYAGTARGTNVWQWDATGSIAQQWVLRPTGDGDGSFYVVSRANGLYLDVAYAGTANGTNVWTWSHTGTGAQKFYLNRL